ncbi:MAG: aminopeptidase [Gammaproteobacteria bacterium]|nr:aminopeptidase [Gammaproteobacteria bacterium]
MALLLGGCTTLGYYAQAVRGQLGVVAASRPVDALLADATLDPAVRERLLRLDELRRFAVDELHLVDSDSYRDYAQLDREAMVWSLVAAPVDALDAHQWCYPVLGCASYRGYFDRAAADAHAERLRDAGWDVAVEAVPAYSTLGWFDDPLPSTVIHWPLADIAALLFHERAHETLYVRDDSAFNEAYATLIEREGVRRWLQQSGDATMRRAWRDRASRRSDFLALLDTARTRLLALYAEAPPRAELLARKRAVFAALRADYARQREAWGGYAGYDRWFARPLNNAHLVSISTYNALLPAFAALLREVDGDMRRFQARCRELAALGRAERHARLSARLASATDTAQR